MAILKLLKFLFPVCFLFLGMTCNNRVECEIQPRCVFVTATLLSDGSEIERNFCAINTNYIDPIVEDSVAAFIQLYRPLSSSIFRKDTFISSYRKTVCAGTNEQSYYEKCGYNCHVYHCY